VEQSIVANSSRIWEEVSLKTQVMKVDTQNEENTKFGPIYALKKHWMYWQQF